MYSTLRTILFLAAICLVPSSGFSQKNDLEQALNERDLAFKEVNKALLSMIDSDSYGMAHAAFALHINDANYAVGRCIKYCSRTIEYLNGPIVKLDSLGCSRSTAAFRTSVKDFQSAISELKKAEGGFSVASGSGNPFHQRRLYDEASLEIATARRHILTAIDGMEDGISYFDDCLK